MLTTLDNKPVYVVDLKEIPETPIMGFISVVEEYYIKLVEPYRTRSRYAEALSKAIETGIITEPGKYAIYLVPGKDLFEVYTISEPTMEETNE